MCTSNKTTFVMSHNLTKIVYSYTKIHQKANSVSFILVAKSLALINEVMNTVNSWHTPSTLVYSRALI